MFESLQEKKFKIFYILVLFFITVSKKRLQELRKHDDYDLHKEFVRLKFLTWKPLMCLVTCGRSGIDFAGFTNLLSLVLGMN